MGGRPVPAQGALVVMIAAAAAAFAATVSGNCVVGYRDSYTYAASINVSSANHHQGYFEVDGYEVPPLDPDEAVGFHDSLYGCVTSPLDLGSMNCWAADGLVSGTVAASYDGMSSRSVQQVSSSYYHSHHLGRRTWVTHS